MDEVDDQEYFTPPQVARQLTVKHDTVLAWIHAHELQAVNLAARSGGQRPRWRISKQAIEKFLARRSATPPPKPRRRRRQPDGVTKYYK